MAGLALALLTYMTRPRSRGWSEGCWSPPFTLRAVGEPRAEQNDCVSHCRAGGRSAGLVALEAVLRFAAVLGLATTSPTPMTGVTRRSSPDPAWAPG